MSATKSVIAALGILAALSMGLTAFMFQGASAIEANESGRPSTCDGSPQFFSDGGDPHQSPNDSGNPHFCPNSHT